MLFNIWLSWDDARGCPVNVTEVEVATHYYDRFGIWVKDPATRNDIVNDGKHFHRRRWYSTIATISSKLDTLTFDQRLERFSLRSGYLRSFI